MSLSTIPPLPANGFRTLTDGDRVDFVIETGPKGLRSLTSAKSSRFWVGIRLSQVKLA